VTADAPATRSLELLIGRARVAVPVTTIARVVGVTYGPLPLAHRLVAGLGFEAKRAIVCISLLPARGGREGGTTKAVLLDTAGRIGFGLCIDEALELVDVVNVERGTVQSNLPKWVRRARTVDGRTLGWIDTDVLIGELSGEVHS
jgi:hypothetical protein